MALSFNDQRGSAQKADFATYKMADGENSVRIVGDILARYVYWVKGENGKNIPVECLAFNRDTESFDRAEKDWVAELYPDLKASWSYATQCIADGKLQVFNLKKKLWEQICTAAEDLGDPTDIEKGWDIKFKKVKTGPLPYNVEYQLQPLKCKPRALSDSERGLIADIRSMDDVMKRPTPEQQKEFLDKLRNNESAASKSAEEALEEEFKVD